LQPAPRTSSAWISADVQSRAPAASQYDRASAQSIKPLHSRQDASAPEEPGQSQPSDVGDPHTFSSPSWARSSHPRSSQVDALHASAEKGAMVVGWKVGV
jgi:hypothetical protein